MLKRCLSCWALGLLGWSATAAQAQVTQKSLYSAMDSNQSMPGAQLLQASDGNFYGVTNGYGSQAHGTIFKLSCDGSTYSTVIPFSSGEYLLSGLVEAEDGLLYGNVYASRKDTNSQGFVFKLSKSGRLETVHTFTGPDGAKPISLVKGPDGRIFGATQYGGADAGEGFGTVFELSSSGELSTLHDFGDDDGAVGGAHPHSTLVAAPDGTLYGTTSSGGEKDGGTVFKIDREGQFSVVAAFGQGTAGSVPNALVLATNGKLYGKVVGGKGSVFELTVEGQISVLHAFTGEDGEFSSGNRMTTSGAGLMQARDGKLYGTAERGGESGWGNVFRVATDGTFEIVYAFAGKSDGGAPRGLMQATDGNIYGTYTSYPFNATIHGGLFKLTLPDTKSSACAAGGAAGSGGSAAAGSGGSDAADKPDASVSDMEGSDASAGNKDASPGASDEEPADAGRRSSIQDSRGCSVQGVRASQDSAPTLLCLLALAWTARRGRARKLC